MQGHLVQEQPDERFLSSTHATQQYYPPPDHSWFCCLASLRSIPTSVAEIDKKWGAQTPTHNFFSIHRGKNSGGLALFSSCVHNSCNNTRVYRVKKIICETPIIHANVDTKRNCGLGFVCLAFRLWIRGPKNRLHLQRKTIELTKPGSKVKQNLDMPPFFQTKNGRNDILARLQQWMDEKDAQAVVSYGIVNFFFM